MSPNNWNQRHTRTVFFLMFALASWLAVVSSRAEVNYYSKTYGGTKSEQGWSIFQTTDGGCAVTGYTGSFGVKGDDAWVLKLDDAGNVQWQKVYGGIYDDIADLIIERPDGGFMLVGSTNSYGAGRYDVWIVALSANGSIQWQKTYGGVKDDMAVSIQSTLDGGFIVAGETRSFGVGYWDIWVLKLSVNGTIEWQKTYGGSGWETTSADPIQQTSDGGYIVAGRTNSYGAGNLDLWVLKLDTNGAIQWQKTYGGPKDELARAVRQTKDGGFVVVGYTESYGAGDLDIWALKLTASGSLEWQKTFGTSFLEKAYSVWDTPDNGSILAGYTWSHTTGNDSWLIKLEADGAVQWHKTTNGGQGDVACAVRPTTDGGYVVAGLKLRLAGDWDFWILKLNGEGIIPACSFIKTAYANVNNTSVNGVNSPAVGLNSQATINTIYNSPKNTTAAVKTQCFESVACFDPVRIAGPVPWYFSTLADALEGAEDGDAIQAQALTFTETLALKSSKSLFIDGGHDCLYTSASGLTEISGSVTVEKGTLTLKGLSIK